jgi:hypothetical protein
MVAMPARANEREAVNMVKRLQVTDAIRAAMSTIPPSCEFCGDDMDIHEWIDVDEFTDDTVNCDRADTDD